ncbi:MAG TPA: VCBS repeat-containing protein, partial [bacterium]|nr:VCBS repeat-containing protein [bacterium]
MIVAMWRWIVLSALSTAACSREPESQSLVEVVPLRARAAVVGKRFARLDPAATGLRFRNELRRENTIAYVYMGAGLAVGDYDADGLPDVYLVSQDGPNKLFRQVAPLRFEDVTAAAGIGLDGGDAWGTAASFADVDGDGDLDLYVCNLESPNLLFVNEGDGTFVEKAGMFGLGAACASTGAAFADYDNDGDLDLYLLTNRVLRPTLAQTPELVREMTLPASIRKSREELLAVDLRFEFKGREFMAGQPDRLFRNDGYAQFVEVTDEAGLHDHGNGLSVVWWDFDDDGWQDLYVANDFQSPDLLWRNRGDGTFEDVTKEMLPHTAFFGMGCDFGDIDGDGRMDLCVADMSSTSHYMGKMLMGYMDRHRWFLMNSDPPQVMRNALYVNTGAERFLEAAQMAGLASTDWTWSVRFADLDEDGRL